MQVTIEALLYQYIDELKKIYSRHLQTVILYGSYARGDYNVDSDVDIMILLDMPDKGIKEFRHALSDMTYDFNMQNNMDIKPIAKNQEHFMKWVVNYPFYAEVAREGVRLFETA